MDQIPQQPDMAAIQAMIAEAVAALHAQANPPPPPVVPIVIPAGYPTGLGEDVSSCFPEKDVF
jgi:hypothetical protein